MRTSDGIELSGNTPAELVRELRLAAPCPQPSDLAFMRLAAARAQLDVGKRIRCDTAENFIADLLLVGLLEE